MSRTWNRQTGKMEAGAGGTIFEPWNQWLVHTNDVGNSLYGSRASRMRATSDPIAATPGIPIAKQRLHAIRAS